MSRKRTLDLRSMSLDDLQRTAEAIIREIQVRAGALMESLADASHVYTLRRWCEKRHDQNIYRTWRTDKSGQRRPNGCGECKRIYNRTLKQSLIVGRSTSSEFNDAT